MKKSAIYFSISLCFLSASAFANECIDNIDTRINGGFELVLDSCKINDNDMQAVSAYLQSHPAINSIYLDKNDISTQGIAYLKAVPSLTSLFIGDNKLGADAAKLVAQFPSLETLAIHNNNIGAEGAKALSKNTTIRQLFVDNNNITPEGIIALANHPTVWNLGAGKNSFDKKALKALANNKLLRWLDIQNSNISPDDAIGLKDHSEKLELLDVSNNPIGDKGIKAVVQVDSIDTLYATGCSIGDEGASAIAKMQKLGDLTIDKNHISEQGAAALAKSEIQRIDLSDNLLEDDGASAFASTNPKIESLYLDHNDIWSNGAIALAKNATLKNLGLAYNHIGTKGLDALKNSKLDYYVEGNITYPDSDLDIKAIARNIHVLKSNNSIRTNKDDKSFIRHYVK